MGTWQAFTVGKWPVTQFVTLMDLLHEIKETPPPPNSLLAIQSFANGRKMIGSDRPAGPDDVEADRRRLVAHPLWPKIRGNPEWRALARSFHVNLNRSKRPVNPRDDFALLFFALLMARHYASLRKKGAAEDSSGLRSKDRTGAAAAIKRLKGFRSKGMALADPASDRTLANLLDQLEIEIKATRRKTYVGLKFAETNTLRTFTELALLRFGDTSETVLSRFSDFAGLDLEISGIRKILAQERKAHGAWLDRSRTSTKNP